VEEVRWWQPQRLVKKMKDAVSRGYKSSHARTQWKKKIIAVKKKKSEESKYEIRGKAMKARM